VIKIGRGRYAFYAHMQPRSLRVRMGQRVKRGQVLGRLGNTGNSDAPHLHFQIMNGPGPLSFDGLPFELRSFVSRGTITSPLDERFVRQGEPAVIGPVNRGRHRSRLPLNNASDRLSRVTRRRGRQSSLSAHSPAAAATPQHSRCAALLDVEVVAQRFPDHRGGRFTIALGSSREGLA
jgi:murein DD-endopeptidase MepM/ murein hydrolase activator NlpD